MRALTLALLLLATPALANKVAVVVLYFDNNTPNRDYDVLQKGLADMLITDLSASDQLQVVEREKLESLVGELKLQKSKYFDAATAQKVGKMVGAKYAVTGAFAAFDPEMRLDVRLLEVDTSKVVASQSVRGGKDKLFDLEAELVQKFLANLKATLPASGGRASGTGNFNAALNFSQSLDASDQGDLKAASTKMASVVRDAPDFSLAKSRYKQLLERLRAAGKKREGVLTEEEKDLVKGMDENIKKFSGQVLKGIDVETYFCYRAMRTGYLLWKLEQVLGPASGPLGYRAATKANRAEVARWVKDIYENETALIEDAVKNHQTLQYMNHALSCGMSFYRANKGVDFYRLKPLGIPWSQMPNIHPGERTAQLVEFAVNGNWERAKFDDEQDELPEVKALPTQVTLEAATAPKLMKLLDAAKKHLELPMSRSVETETLKLEGARAALLLRLGKREEAIASLQSFLEKYPKSRSYKAVEGLVEGLLGVSEAAQKNSDAIVACRADDKTVRGEIDRRYDADGLGGVKELLGKIPDGCGAKKKVQAVAAWNAAVRGDCAGVKELSGVDEAAAARGLCE